MRIVAFIIFVDNSNMSAVSHVANEFEYRVRVNTVPTLHLIYSRVSMIVARFLHFAVNVQLECIYMLIVCTLHLIFMTFILLMFHFKGIHRWIIKRIKTTPLTRAELHFFTSCGDVLKLQDLREMWDFCSLESKKEREGKLEIQTEFNTK